MSVSLGWFQHVDLDGAAINVVRAGSVTSMVKMADAAVAELGDDLAYQIEFTDVPAYRAQCKRAVAALTGKAG